MRIGLDVDGVLANFFHAFETLVIRLDPEHRNLFPLLGPEGPITWHWPQYWGYSDVLMDFKNGLVWDYIRRDKWFWYRLPSLPDMHVLEFLWTRLRSDHEVYFITNRVGDRAKHQTEEWLRARGIDIPTVIITSKKGETAKLLNLDAYVDDNWDNVIDVGVQCPACQTFLIDRAYNRPNSPGVTSYAHSAVDRVIRVASLSDFFSRLGIRH